MTLSFLFDVEFDPAIVGVRASHRDRRQIIEHSVGVPLNGRLAGLAHEVCPGPECRRITADSHPVTPARSVMTAQSTVDSGTLQGIPRTLAKSRLGAGPAPPHPAQTGSSRPIPL